MLNKVEIMGRLVADPELRRTQTDVSVTSFTLAVERDFKDKNGDRQADFLDCVAWRGTAEFIERNFHKGNMAIVVGNIQTRMFEDKEKHKRKATEILVENMYFGESKRDSVHGAEAAPAESYGEIIADDANLPF